VDKHIKGELTIHSLYNAFKLYLEIKLEGFLVDQKSLKVYTLASFCFLPQNVKSAMVDLPKGFSLPLCIGYLTKKTGLISGSIRFCRMTPCMLYGSFQTGALPW
jgi:hypothetical protein